MTRPAYTSYRVVVTHAPGSDPAQTVTPWAGAYNCQEAYRLWTAQLGKTCVRVELQARDDAGGIHPQAIVDLRSDLHAGVTPWRAPEAQSEQMPLFREAEL